MSTLKNYSSTISFIVILCAIYWSISSLSPGNNVLKDTPLTEFSTQRALNHVKEISQEAHFIGTSEHKKVQNYIKTELEKLGLEVEIQSQMALNHKWRAAVNTENIISRIKGSGTGKSLLLLSHYDSAVHSSKGASDAGSGVATVLEGVRAYLATNPSPKNDIIIVLTDAEEIGLLGARAFANHHPWVKNIDLILNFEARGSGGPSFMLLETNGGNKNLVKAFNRANPEYPVASSLLYSVYKMLPNDTDLTVFREGANINGFNFAFIDDHFDYHTVQDSYERLDRNSLKHQGAYLMPLLKYFAVEDISNLESDEDYVYFNFPGFTLINYPFSWVLPMVILASILLLIIVIIGLKKSKLSMKELLIGFVPLISALLVNGLISFYGWKVILKIHPQYQDILHGFTYNGYFYITAFVALTIGITLWINKIFSDKYSFTNLSMAPILIWIILNFLVAFYLPGAGFFILIVFFALFGLLIELFTNLSNNTKVLINTLLSLPLIILFVPLIQTFPVGLGLKMLVISAVLTVLVLSLLLPVLVNYKIYSKLSRLFVLIAVLSFISTAFTSGYNEERKQPNSILYILDDDKKEANWVSYNNDTDDFTKQFFGEDLEFNDKMDHSAASKYNTGYKLIKNTQVLDLKTPIIEIIQDTIIGSDRKISLKIVPQRKVNRLDLISKKTLHIKEFQINGEALQRKQGEEYVFTTEDRKFLLAFYFTQEHEQLNLSFTVPKNDPIDLEILESSYDLYTNPKIKTILPEIIPRTETMMPMPFVLNDAIIVKKQIKL